HQPAADLHTAGWTRAARPALGAISSDPGKWKGRFPVGLRVPTAASPAAGARHIKAVRHHTVRSLRSARRIVHAVAHGGSHARSGAGVCVVLDLAGSSGWSVRGAWGRRS